MGVTVTEAGLAPTSPTRPTPIYFVASPCHRPGLPPRDSPQCQQVPGLLQKHFPEHGPYLGVYAQVVSGGTIRPGDRVVRVGQREGSSAATLAGAAVAVAVAVAAMAAWADWAAE